MLGSNLDTNWLRMAQLLAESSTLLPDPDSLLAPLAPLVADADVVLLNVEGAIGRGRAPRKCRPGSTRCYAFRQDPAVAGALRRLAPHARVAGNVANNHAMDAGATGFNETVGHLVDARVHVVGADSLPALVPLPAGDTLAILGFSVFSAGPDARDLTSVARHVARAAGTYARVVVSLHVGAEGRDAQRTPDAPERFAGEDRGNPVAIARTAVDAGADLVIGHGPHVLRAVEWREASLIAYSLGNLATYGPFSREPPLDRGAILCAVLDEEGRVRQADLRPTRQRKPGLPFPDPEYAAFDLVDSLSALDFPGTAARIIAGMIRRPR
jgi:poly-gamma-glutamate capsule biosynthesis protein CapA/YwtB (metallophosphatase superfamily)